jgi:hypothetical protein
MAFKFIESSATGSYQTLFNRLIEDPEVIDLTDTPGVLSLKSIPLDGVDDSFTLGKIILLEDIGASGASGASADVITIDSWIKPSITGQNENTFFDASIMRSESAVASAFDGIYSCHVLTTGGNRYIDFRLDFDVGYSLTSMSTISLTSWQHVYCQYTSADSKVSIYIDGILDREGILNDASASQASKLGSRTVAFGGIIDETRLWICSGAASSINQIAAASAIGLDAADLNNMNDFTPSADVLAARWRFESISAFQLFSGISNSIIDDTINNHHGTPFGFEGSDNISSETTIIQGLSASGDLQNLIAAELDHGGLTVLDPNNNTISLEIGSENLINEINNVWVATGSGVVITQEDKNIFYGNSGVKVNTTSADTGVFQDVSNSALLFVDNTYTMSFRYRSITGSTSARVIFTLGGSAVSKTAVTDVLTWEPIILRNTVPTGGALTGKVEIIGLNSDNNAGSLFHIDGLQVIEGDYPASFIGHSRMRKSSQVTWPILD